MTGQEGSSQAEESPDRGDNVRPSPMGLAADTRFVGSFQSLYIDRQCIDFLHSMGNMVTGR